LLKRDIFFVEAEKLYCIKLMTLKAIAEKLKLNEKTVRTWKNVGGWEAKRKQYLKNKLSFDVELYDFSKILMESVKKDIALDKRPNNMNLYVLASILPIVFQQKKQEEARLG